MDEQSYLDSTKKKFPPTAIKSVLDRLVKLKVLVIGDTIIDEYVFTNPKGRAIKDPILSLDFLRSEMYAGGALAIANHISQFTPNVSLITLLGDFESKEDFVVQSLNRNVSVKVFTKRNSPTTVKKRYIDYVRNGKLFKVEYINDKPLDEDTETEIANYLKLELPKYDLAVIGDFGHGFIGKKIVDVLEKHSKFLAANVQTNSSNMGFNYITKYNRLDYLVSNDSEIRLAMSDRFGDLPDVMEKLRQRTAFRNILLTIGKEGCRYIKNNHCLSAPALTQTVKDVVGAGDAVFAVTALLSYNDGNEELLAFIANCVGAMAVNIMGNKESITKPGLMNFVESVYNGMA